MASLRKRNNLWQAQVRIKNSGSISKSFNLRKDALIWATTQENLMQRGESYQVPENVFARQMEERGLKKKRTKEGVFYVDIHLNKTHNF
ncbi:hypothetical protein N9V16_05815 [SAR116 cluster bacterium]|nr:hypothetical protein [SAR116 cluster bacterium]